MYIYIYIYRERERAPNLSEGGDDAAGKPFCYPFVWPTFRTFDVSFQDEKPFQDVQRLHRHRLASYWHVEQTLT